MNSLLSLSLVAALAILAYNSAHPEVQIRLYECRLEPEYVTPRPRLPCTALDRLASRILSPLFLKQDAAHILTVGDMYLEIVAMTDRCLDVWVEDAGCIPPAILACYQLWQCSREIAQTGRYRELGPDSCSGESLAVDYFSFNLVMTTLKSGGNLTRIVEELPLSACCLAKDGEPEKDTLEGRMGGARQANPREARF